MNTLKTGLAATILTLTAITISARATEAQSQAPPGGDFQKVSELVELPEFIPGLGARGAFPAVEDILRRGEIRAEADHP